MKKLILSLFCGALGFTYAQETDANILGSVEIGGARYYVLQEPGSGKYFKSEITSVNVLKYGDIVKLDQQLDPNGFQQIKDASFNNLFKAKEQTSGNSNNGVNYVDPSILYRLPKVYRGMLVFDNKKHFDELYNTIDAYLETKKSIPGKKDALTLVESQISDYTSFREFFLEKYPDEGINDEGYTDNELEIMEKEDFIHDEIVKFFLNKNRMVIIEKDVFYYHDFHTSLKYKVDFLDQFQNENERISQIPEFDIIEGGTFLTYRKEVDVLSDILFVSKDLITDPKPVDPLNPKYNFSTVHVIQYSTNPCDFQKIKFRVITLLDGVPYQLLPTHNADLLVNFPGVVKQYGPLHLPWIPYQNQFVEHFDPIPGSKNISYDLSFFVNGQLYQFRNGFPSTLYPNQSPIIYDIPPGVCTEINDSENKWEQSGVWKMYAEVWVSNNWIGNRVGALTHSYKKKNNGNWVRKIANIEAEINAYLRNDECNHVETISDQDIENQERVDVVKWKLFKKYKSIMNFDINSHHVLSKGGVTIYVNLKITGC